MPTAKKTGTRAPAGLARGLGGAGLLTQLAVIRELALLFSGNEMVLGVTLAAWLAGTAVGSGGFRIGSDSLLVKRWIWLAALSPILSLLLLRSAQTWLTVYGGTPGPAAMAALALAAGAPPAAAGGWWFSALLARSRPDASGNLFAAEVGGSCLAGLAYTALLAHWWHPLAISGVAAGFMLYLAIRDHRLLSPGIRRLLAGLLILGLAGLGLRWDAWFPTRIPGQILLASYTARDHVLVVRNQSLFSIFKSGQLAYSLPDAERSRSLAAVLQALAAEPRRIAIAGSNPELLSAMLTDTRVLSLEWYEEDAEGQKLLAAALLESWKIAGADSRLVARTEDLRQALQQSDADYDLICVNVGLPANLSLNRFYTREFMVAARQRLAPGGCLAIVCDVSPERLSPGEGVALASIWKALGDAYPGCQLLAGDAMLMMGSRDRPISAKTVLQRADSLPHPQDFKQRWDLARSQEFQSELAVAAAAANTDLHPVAVGYQTWSWFRKAGNAGGLAAGLLLLATTAVFWRKIQPNGDRMLMAMAGGALMFLEIAVATAYQYRRGNLWEELGLLFAVTMAGAAAGAKLGSLGGKTGSWPVWVLAGLCVSGSGIVMLTNGHPFWAAMVLAAGSVTSGMIWTGKTANRLEPATVWAWDAAGSALAASLTGVFLIPVLGLAAGLVPALGLVLSRRRKLGE